MNKTSHWHTTQKMNSSASAYQFNPHDPRYYQCLCCARLHVSALAKAMAVICIISNILQIWGAIVQGTDVKSVVWILFVSGVMAVAVFQEHRPTLTLLLVLQGLSIAAAVVVIILFVGIFIFKADLPPEMRAYGPFVYVMAVYVIALMFWSFAIMLHFYTFLTDRERAGAVAVMYEARQPFQQRTTEGSRGGRLVDEKRSPRPSRDGHIPYPIYTPQRTPSLTPAHSPLPTPMKSAPEPVMFLHPPPPYGTVDESKTEENKDDEK
ncbi:hypothetical protein PMAYCL1PPCAC_15722 [Pristionchus mayeri]|uniref:Uncharacterized protein n=1 Tax=Pristionchus mayeri TaxID=1317129 RepID=A0AAN5CJE2_9BILA|nr:hypothetical protein PMAYCL1PPCAC_15722 [Pristionchus mayeri]